MEIFVGGPCLPWHPPGKFVLHTEAQRNIARPVVLDVSSKTSRSVQLVSVMFSWQVVLVIFLHFVIGQELEVVAGWLRTAIIYFFSAIGGLAVRIRMKCPVAFS